MPTVIFVRNAVKCIVRLLSFALTKYEKIQIDVFLVGNNVKNSFVKVHPDIIIIFGGNQHRQKIYVNSSKLNYCSIYMHVCVK